MFFGSLAFIFEVMIYVGLGLPLVNLLISLVGGAGDSGPEVELDGDLALDGGMDAGFDTGIDAGGADLDIDLDFDAPDLDFEIDAGGLDLAPGGMVPATAGAGVPAVPAGGHGFALRFNLYCLCLAFVVMGAVGIFALEALAGTAQAAMLAGGLALAAGAYVLLYRFVVWPLKKNDAHALNQGNLRFRHARVTFRISPESPGTIQTKDATGAVISYRAEVDRDLSDLERIEEGTEVIITDLDKSQNLCYVTPAQRKLLDAPQPQD